MKSPPFAYKVHGQETTLPGDAALSGLSAVPMSSPLSSPPVSPQMGQLLPSEISSLDNQNFGHSGNAGHLLSGELLTDPMDTECSELDTRPLPASSSMDVDQAEPSSGTSRPSVHLLPSEFSLHQATSPADSGAWPSAKCHFS